MTNVHVFELINAGPGLAGLRLFEATALAQWAPWWAAAALGVAWVRGCSAERGELLQMLLAVLLALATGQLVSLIWPQPRPFALHLGYQHLVHEADAGLPSGHVTALWSLGLAALASRRHALLGFPMLALGLVVGWCRVYLGVNFPLDVLAAMPVALLGVVLAQLLSGRVLRASTAILSAYDRLERAVRARLRSTRPG